MAKVSVFGPRDRSPSSEATNLLASRLLQVKHLDVVATGGVIGFPTRIIQAIGSQTNRPKIRAYTPCLNSSEWGSFQEKGLLPEEDIFDEIYWRNVDEREIKERALARIPQLVAGSLFNLAYLVGAGNTHLEVMSSLFLGIDTYCLTEGGVAKKCWESFYRSASRGHEHLKIYSDASELDATIERERC